MAKEEHTQKCSNSSSGGGVGGGAGGSGGGGGGGVSSGSRSSKRLKQKKVPQRGLGVAQLEKIRIEEQQKKEAAFHQAQAVNNNKILAPNSSIISPSNSSSCLAVQCHAFRPSVSQTPIPFPPPPSSTNDTNSLMIRPGPSMAGIDVLHPNQVPGPWPKFWNGAYNVEGDNRKVDGHGFMAVRPNAHLSYESNPAVLPLPSWMQQRSHHFQQPSSSMVNVSSGISSSSQSLIDLQMEPPSNQSYCGNKYTPLWPEEEKMIGLKRQYPFSLEIPPAPPFHCKFPSSLVAPITRSDDSASCSNGSPANTEPSNRVIREGPSSLNVVTEQNPRRLISQNGHLNGDFLTLAPPAASSPFSSSMYKHPFTYSGSSSRELSVTSQESSEDLSQRPRTGGSNVQTFFSFLPSAAKVQVIEAPNRVRCDSEVGESVDLNLKL